MRARPRQVPRPSPPRFVRGPTDPGNCVSNLSSLGPGTPIKADWILGKHAHAAATRFGQLLREVGLPSSLVLVQGSKSLDQTREPVFLWPGLRQTTRGQGSWNLAEPSPRAHDEEEHSDGTEGDESVEARRDSGDARGPVRATLNRVQRLRGQGRVGVGPGYPDGRLEEIVRGRRRYWDRRLRGRRRGCRGRLGPRGGGGALRGSGGRLRSGCRLRGLLDRHRPRGG